jgi:hypothetical protein
MATALRFRDHGTFHRSAAVMMGAGAVAAVALQAVGVGEDPRSWAGVLAAVAVLAAAPSLRRSRPRWALWLAIPVIAAVIWLAYRTAAAIAGAQVTASLPGWAGAALAGTAFSLVAIAALLPWHVGVARDAVGAAHAALARSGAAGGEVGEITGRAVELWRTAEARLPETDATRATLEQAVLRLLEIARRWQSVEAERPDALGGSLADRAEALDRRIAEARDPVARAQYQQARDALGSQRRYVEEIAAARERVVARLHHYLAAMEQLRLAALHVESTHACDGERAIQPLVSELDELGREIELDADVEGSAGRRA